MFHAEFCGNVIHQSHFPTEDPSFHTMSLCLVKCHSFNGKHSKGAKCHSPMIWVSLKVRWKKGKRGFRVKSKIGMRAWLCYMKQESVQTFAFLQGLYTFLSQNCLLFVVQIYIVCLLPMWFKLQIQNL